MPSEIEFVSGEEFVSAFSDANKLFIVAPAGAIKDGTAFEAMRASKEPLAVRGLFLICACTCRLNSPYLFSAGTSSFFLLRPPTGVR